MKSHARVVIIGAGIVGCSAAYYLTCMGWRDIVVCDQGPLFQNWGSTSHAPGLMFQHNNSRSTCLLAQWSVETYKSIPAVNGRMVYQTGSLEIAHTPERWQELKRKQGNAMAWGLESFLVTPSEVKRMVPIMRTDDLFGAFYVPSDCDVKAALLCESLAACAAAAGAEFHPYTPVTAIAQKKGRVSGVETPSGSIACESIICAAGLWGPLVGNMVGVTLPMTPMQHLYARTEPLPELLGETEDVRHPVVRYQDKDLYFRQHADAYGLGTYRHDPLIVPPADLPRNDHPAIFPFTPECFEESWCDALDRFPCFEGKALVQQFNGLFSFTPDGNSLLGESAQVRGFWAAEAVWVTHGGGVGRAIAEWLVAGAPSLDLHDHDVNRFHPFAFSREYIETRARRQYIEVYDIIHPLQQTENPRGLRTSPFHMRLKNLGAVFFEGAGWERAHWFEGNASLPGKTARSGWEAQYWSPVIGAEHRAVRECLGMFDLTAFTKLEITGDGSLAFLQHLAANQMDQPIGKTTYTSLLNEQGGIECDLTVTRLGPRRFWVITGAGVGMHDLAWLRKHLPDNGSVSITDITSQYTCVGLWGPRARDLLQSLTRDDVSAAAFPYLTARALTVDYAPVHAIRISYAGELGWEIYTPVEYGLYLWDTLWQAGQPLGVVAAGGGAFDSLRLEKGYRLWGVDIHHEHNPYEAGLGFAVRMNKGDFIGRAALERVRAAGPSRKLCCLTFDDPAHIVMGREPILNGEDVLGFVTSANFGYSIGKSIAYGYLPLSHASPGTPLSVYYFGDRFPATVSAEPLFDPQMVRLKA